jgi:dTDP-4-dehydrorhamnose reductase
VSPSVVADQVGRLTFTSELSRGTKHLHRVRAPYGTYNITNSGDPTSWADVAKAVFQLSGRSDGDVTPVSTETYGQGRALAPRPRNSVLDLAKITATGFEPEDALSALERYLSN